MKKHISTRRESFLNKVWSTLDRIRRKWKPLTACAVAAFLPACSTLVAVPDKANDSPPTITVSWVPKNGRASASSASATAPPNKAVGVTFGSQLTVLAAANNKGGVKDFHLKIIKGGLVQYDLTTSAHPDAQGLVPDALHIDGSNVNHDQLGNLAIVLTFNEPLNGNLTGEAYTVQADAHNFNNQPFAISFYLQEMDDTLVP